MASSILAIMASAVAMESAAAGIVELNLGLGAGGAKNDSALLAQG